MQNRNAARNQLLVKADAVATEVKMAKTARKLVTLCKVIGGSHRLVVKHFIVVCLLTIAGSVSSFSQSSELVHRGDMVDVDVVGGFEFDWRGSVNPEGFLEGFDTVEEPVPALCRTEAAIAETIALRLSKVLREPKVVVRIIDRSKRAVAIVEGAVRTSSRFQLNREATLVELIALSGGLTEDSSGEIRLFRPESLNCEVSSAIDSSQSGNDAQFRSIRITDLISGFESANPVILSGDIVTVERAAVIYVIGGVVNPRMISARSQTSLERAIAMSGGLIKQATGLATIYRRENGETRIIESDVAKVLEKSVADVDLKPFDIVDIQTKGSPKRKLAPVIDGRREGGNGILPLKIVE